MMSNKITEYCSHTKENHHRAKYVELRPKVRFEDVSAVISVSCGVATILKQKNNSTVSTSIFSFIIIAYCTRLILINNNYYTLRWVHRGVAGCRRDVMVTECNAPFASWMKAVLAVAKKQGLAFVVVEREDGSRSGETAPGRSRGRRK